MLQTLVGSPIIGQTPLQTLGAIHAPAFLPEGVARFLFETQWVVWIVLAHILAIIAIIALRYKPKWLPVVYVADSVLILWFVLTIAVETRTERLLAVNRRILDAVVNKDVNALLAELDDDFSFGNIRKPELALALQTGFPGDFSSNTIRLFEATPGTPDSEVHMNLFSTGKNASLLTHWDLLFKEEPDGSYKLHTVTAWKIGDEPQKLGLPDLPW